MKETQRKFYIHSLFTRVCMLADAASAAEAADVVIVAPDAVAEAGRGKAADAAADCSATAVVVVEPGTAGWPGTLATPLPSSSTLILPSLSLSLLRLGTAASPLLPCLLSESEDDATTDGSRHAAFCPGPKLAQLLSPLVEGLYGLGLGSVWENERGSSGDPGVEGLPGTEDGFDGGFEGESTSPKNTPPFFALCNSPVSPFE